MDIQNKSNNSSPFLFQFDPIQANTYHLLTQDVLRMICIYGIVFIVHPHYPHKLTTIMCVFAGILIYWLILRFLIKIEPFKDNDRD